MSKSQKFLPKDCSVLQQQNRGLTNHLIQRRKAGSEDCLKQRRASSCSRSDNSKFKTLEGRKLKGTRWKEWTGSEFGHGGHGGIWESDHTGVNDRVTFAHTQGADWQDLDFYIDKMEKTSENLRCCCGTNSLAVFKKRHYFMCMSVLYPCDHKHACVHKHA